MGTLIRTVALIAFSIAACIPTRSANVSTSTPEIGETSTALPQTADAPQLVIPTVVQNQETRRDIELPEWVSGSFPGGILVLPYSNAPGNRPSKSILVNPDDGETFIIDLQEEFYHYYWRDSEHVVFFHNGDCGGLPETISDIDLFNSTLQEYSAKSHPEYILSCYFNSDDEIVRLNYEFSELAVEFVDPSGGAISFLTDPNDGITDISVELSPSKNFVAVVQFVGDFEFPGSRVPVYGNQISIYDLRTQRLILYYTEEQGIFSETSFINYGTLAYMRGNTPCLIMILSLLKKCIHNIPNQFPDSTIILSKNSHEDSTLRFLHFSPRKGGYCFYNIITGGLGCPTDRFSTFDNQFVINYSLSSFGHFLLVEYDSKGCPLPWCDYAENPHLGLIDFYDGELFELGLSENFFIQTFFRPLHPDPWQPWR